VSSYDLNVAPSGHPDIPGATGDLITINEERLTLLYGPNGSGKTTLLRTLFHALSPADDRGHRTALFETPFERLDISFSDAGHISYHRQPDRLIGPYTAEIRRQGAETIRWDYTRSAGRWTTAGNRLYGYPAEAFEVPAYVPQLPDMPISIPQRTVTPEERFIQALVDLSVTPVFLGDSRAITSDALERDDTRAIEAGQVARDFDGLVRATRNIDIHEAVERVRRYLSQLAFAGAQEGSQRVDSVYLTVADTIVQAASRIGRPSKSIIPSLIHEIENVGARAKTFHNYGLLPEFPTDNLITALSDAPDKQGPLLTRVLDPYLQGLVERMDALEPGLLAVSAFIDALNSFLEGKRVEFRPGSVGVQIIDERSDEPLDPSVLSSGEKQIVLLFCDIIALQGQTRLFIIDEPELSLNPAWQRALMPHLLEVTKRSSMQLIAATHSIEAMARYRNRIRRLEEPKP
jgi:energy-coupling factor transporter ATP-binding protein EcfA2